MSLHEKTKDQIKESMKAGDKVRLEVMRGLVTAFTNELVSTGKTPQELLNDEQALVVINRLAKQRKDSIEQFTKGSRMDLVKAEKAQLQILQEFLPKLMGKSEIEKFVQNKYDKLEIKDITKKGLFMASLMKELRGKADGSMVKEIVDKLENHPLKSMMDKNLLVTINSDDPAYFGGQLNDNYIKLAKALSLTKDDIYQLAKNSFTASFLSDRKSTRLNSSHTDISRMPSSA